MGLRDQGRVGRLPHARALNLDDGDDDAKQANGTAEDLHNQHLHRDARVSAMAHGKEDDHARCKWDARRNMFKATRKQAALCPRGGATAHRTLTKRALFCASAKAAPEPTMPTQRPQNRFDKPVVKPAPKMENPGGKRFGSVSTCGPARREGHARTPADARGLSECMCT